MRCGIVIVLLCSIGSTAAAFRSTPLHTQARGYRCSSLGGDVPTALSNGKQPRLHISSQLRYPDVTRPSAVPPTLAQDLGGSMAVAAASGVWLKIWTSLASAGKVDPKDSRKIIHCGSGPLFMLCWPLFSADPTARLFAAGVPLLQAVLTVISGLTHKPPDRLDSRITTSLTRPTGLVAAVSRTGDPAEVLRGPLIYVIVLLLTTLFFWRDGLVAILAISQMAAGDGVADIAGRRLGSVKWPFSKTKSYAGTAAFAMAGFAVSMGLISWYSLWGLLTIPPSEVVTRVALISLACAAVELIPIWDDNVTVPLAASLLATLLLS